MKVKLLLELQDDYDVEQLRDWIPNNRTVFADLQLSKVEYCQEYNFYIEDAMVREIDTEVMEMKKIYEG